MFQIIEIDHDVKIKGSPRQTVRAEARDADRAIKIRSELRINIPRGACQEIRIVEI